MTEATMGEWDVAVVGGGLAGLVAAATATDAGRRVVLVEPRPPGGRARCDEHDGYVLNRGPRALYLGGPGHQVLEALGVDVSSGGPPPTHGARIALGGRLHRAPDGPAGLLRTTALTGREKVALGRALAAVPKLDASSLVGTTVAAWLDELGLCGAPRALAEAYVRLATYVDAPDALDAGAAVANLQAAIGPGVRYLDGGWQSIVDALADGHRCTVVGAAATAVAAEASGASVAITTDTGLLRARAAVVAVGTPSAARSLLGPAADDDLATVGPPVTAACLELGLRRPSGHPFVIGVDDGIYLSAHAPAARLAPPGGALVHVLRYHRVGEPTDAEADRALLWRAAERAGIAVDDVAVDRFLARMVVSGALPRRPPAAGPVGRPWPPSTGPGSCWPATGSARRMLADAAIASGHRAGRHAAERSATMAVP
ncbi:MAG: NAD(P)-binding protein [Acidimicrobiales bacterium]